MNIWQFSRLVSSRLMRWGLANIVVGTIISRHRDPLWRGIGTQAAGWGLINALIALFGAVTTQNKIASLSNPGETTALEKEKTFLKRLLWLNTGLDVLYVLGGAWLARRNTGNGVMRGHGVGIILQGGFLFVFDFLHALFIEDVSPH
jgi:hypothetical protein